MNAKPTGYVLITVGLLGIVTKLFTNVDMLISGGWFSDTSTLITLIICMITSTLGVRLVKL
ncbi:Uncharacterised protein [uncultured archaeon]|nr:Uncharacterised protein [uncultured archaeon]